MFQIVLNTWSQHGLEYILLPLNAAVWPPANGNILFKAISGSTRQLRGLASSL